MTPSSSARLSYTDFEIAIKAFLDQVNGHVPWTFCEYKEPRVKQQLRLPPIKRVLPCRTSALTSYFIAYACLISLHLAEDILH